MNETNPLPDNELLDELLKLDTREQVSNQLKIEGLYDLKQLENLLLLLSERPTLDEVTARKNYWLHEVIAELFNYDYEADLLSLPLFQGAGAMLGQAMLRAARRGDEEFILDRIKQGNMRMGALSGNRSHNIEMAIIAYKGALELSLKRDNSEQSATIQAHIGNAFLARRRGERANNIELALQHYEQALQVYTREQNPEKWAMLQTNLAHSYMLRIHAKRAESIEKSIEASRQALQIYTYEQHANQWASTQNDLGIAYMKRMHGSKVINKEIAIKAFKKSLLVPLSERNGDTWANTQTNLGNAYTKRLRGKHASNIAAAVHAYEAAMQVFTLEQAPYKFKNVCSNKGLLLYGEKRWDEARKSYEGAHEALKKLRGEAVNDESRRQLAHENENMYEALIHCCLQLEDQRAAADFTLFLKSRSITELIAGDKQSLSELLKQDSALAAEWEKIQSLRSYLHTLTAGILPVPRDEDFIEGLQQELNQLIESLIFRFPSLASIEPPPPLTAPQAQRMSEQLGGIPLVEYIRHGGGWGAFVFTSSDMHYVHLFDYSNEQITDIDLDIDDLIAILSGEFWVHDYKESLRRLYKAYFFPLKHLLPARGQLVLAPAHMMNLFPFQALLNEDNKYLSEEYAISFVPSLATLHVLHEQQLRAERKEQTASQSLLSIAYSSQTSTDKLRPIPFALSEAAAISAYFPSAVHLWEEQALPENVFREAEQNFDVVHISCHAEFNLRHPLESALILAQNQRLTVNDIRLRLRLQGRPLVVLSACQSGQVFPVAGSDNNGLSWAFLAAGASSVIASQWSVNDKATMLLFEAFYSLRQNEQLSNAEALQQAIINIREKYNNQMEPRFWAAFQVLGLPIVQT